jgi:hypothetical protein
MKEILGYFLWAYTAKLSVLTVSIPKNRRKGEA